MLYIHPDECVDCGACEPVCPVEAIYYEDDTPEQWKEYYTANVEFFNDLGSPGGAAKMGVIEKDHALDRGAAAPEPGVTQASAPSCRPPGFPGWAARPVSGRLPDFPWDKLRADGGPGPGPPGRDRRPLRRARPWTRRPQVVQDALRAARRRPGYPVTIGRADLRQACVDWLARRFGVHGSRARATCCPRSAPRS